MSAILRELLKMAFLTLLGVVIVIAFFSCGRTSHVGARGTYEPDPRAPALILQGRAVVARHAHNVEVGGAIPSPATILSRPVRPTLTSASVRQLEAGRENFQRERDCTNPKASVVNLASPLAKMTTKFLVGGQPPVFAVGADIGRAGNPLVSGGVEGNARTRRDGTGRVNPPWGFLAREQRQAQARHSGRTDSSGYRIPPADFLSEPTFSPSRMGTRSVILHASPCGIPGWKPENPPKRGRAMDFLSRLAWAESRNDPRAIGSCGERGLYQISERTWQHVNGMRVKRGEPAVSYLAAFTPSTSAEFASLYLSWLESNLIRAGIENPIPEQLLCAWNLGILGFRRAGFSLQRVPKRTRELIRRFNEL